MTNYWLDYVGGGIEAEYMTFRLLGDVTRGPDVPSLAAWQEALFAGGYWLPRGCEFHFPSDGLVVILFPSRKLSLAFIKCPTEGEPPHEFKIRSDAL